MQPSAPKQAPRSAPLVSRPALSQAEMDAFIRESQTAKGAPAVDPKTILKGPVELKSNDAVERMVGDAQALFPEPDIPAASEARTSPPSQGALQTAVTLGDDFTRPADLTQEEKDIYVKAVLFDKPVVWSISVLGGQARVTCRSLTMAHEDLMAWWLQWGERKGYLPPNMSSLMVSWLNRVGVMLRVMKMETTTGDTATYTPDFMDAEILSNYEAAQIHLQVRDALVERLHAEVEQFVRKVLPAKFHVLHQAMRVHEHKFVTCARAAASGNFWLPAGRA
jgi:hypothetical protein